MPDEPSAPMSTEPSNEPASAEEVPPVHPACNEDHSITDTMLVNGLPSGAHEVTVTLPNLGCCLSDAAERAGGDFAIIDGTLHTLVGKPYDRHGLEHVDGTISIDVRPAGVR